MKAKTISASALQAYLATQPSDTEINLATLATTMQDNKLQEAVTFFSTLSEIRKVEIMFYLYNYYYNILSQEFVSNAWLLELSADNTVLQEIEDDFIIKFNLDTTQLIPLRRLLGRLQKEVCKQRIYKKEEVIPCPLSSSEDCD